MDIVSYSPLTPLTFLRRNAHVYRDKIAVVHGERRFSYAEFNARVNRLASALRREGVQKGDRVAILCPNIPPLLEAHYGVPLAGAALVAINTRLSPEEVAYILRHSGAKVLLFDTELAGTVRSVADKVDPFPLVINIQDVGRGEGIPGPDYETFLASGDPADQPLPVENEDELISINYTSGTTGMPKGVMYSHRGAFLNALSDVVEMGLSNRSVYLWTLPMFHCNGWCFTWGVTAVGGTHVCLRLTDPPTVFRLIETERVSHFCAALTVLIMLTSHPSAQSVRITHGLKVATGGAPPSPTVIEKVESLGAEIIHLYGLTETYGPCSICEWQPAWDGASEAEGARLKARQGVPTVMSDLLRVVDTDMRDVPADGQTMGEVVIRGNNVMKGYFEQPDATAVAFEGGWFHSGDLGVMHPDGYIELRDRKKDIIISGGENISTIEVENLIYQHPAVHEVAVIAIPDDRWGEVPKAYVTLKPGQDLSEAELISFCRDRIAHFKAPKAVEFGELPKTSTGKIQKYLLREQDWAGREKRIN